MRVAACKLDEIDDGAMKALEVNGRAVVLIRRGDDVAALRNVCPHQGATLSGGVVSCRRVAAGVGEYVADVSAGVVRCPWHNWEFDTESGTCFHRDDQRVAVYRVEVEGGEVFLNL